MERGERYPAAVEVAPPQVLKGCCLFPQKGHGTMKLMRFMNHPYYTKFGGLSKWPSILR